MANTKSGNKKLTQLSAIIATIFAEGVKQKRDFAITGYDISRILSDMRMNFSHQQIYRELKALSFLTSKEIPQEGKPNKKVYSVNIDIDEYINTVHTLIDFDPKKTHTKNMYAFSHLPNLVCAYNAHMSFIEAKEKDYRKRMHKIDSGEELNFTVPDLHELNCQIDKITTDTLLSKISRVLNNSKLTELPKEIVSSIEQIIDKNPAVFS